MSKSKEWDSLYGHLEDLRGVLLKSAAVFFSVFILLFSFHSEIVHLFLKEPYEKDSSLKVRPIQLYEVINTSQAPKKFSFSENEPPIEIEAGKRVVIEKTEASSFLILSPIQGFSVVFKIVFWLSLVVSLPLCLVFLLAFVLPGLLPGEKGLILPFFILSFLAVAAGLFFALKVTLPITTAYLLSFNSAIGMNAWEAGAYVDYLLLIYASHAFAAEVALMLFLAVHFDLISSERLCKMRKGVILGVLIMAALITPPDVPSQLMVAIPLMAVYELVIIYGNFRKKKYASNYLTRT